MARIAPNGAYSPAFADVTEGARKAMKITRPRRIGAAAAALGLVLVGAATSHATTTPTPACAMPTVGGDWPAYGGDAHNTRSQPAESTIGAANAGSLAPAWVFSASANGGDGAINSTPVEAGGCVFATTSTGWVFALDATSGALVWKHQLSAPTPGNGGVIVGSPAVAGSAVYVLVNDTADGTPARGPYVAALDQSTGTLRWRSTPVATYVGDYTNASPVVMPVGDDGDHAVVFAGFSPPEGDPQGQGGFALIDTASGAIARVTYTVPPADQPKGYAGGGIWSTPAYDPATQYAYVGTGNPYSKTVEHPNTNAILKISLRARDLGAIAGSYKGNPDQYTQTLQTIASSPVCAATETAPTPLDDPACGQIDLDFGASANLFHAADGTLLVGDLQKAGVYHAARTTDMAPAWATIVGGPCHVCNAGSTATDGRSVFGVSAPGGAAFALDDAGAATWRSVAADATHYQGTSVANGVVYTFDNQGFLDLFDAASGTPVAKRPLAADIGQPAVALTSAGISIARHTVFVGVSGGAAAGAAALGQAVPPPLADTFIVAYRL